MLSQSLTSCVLPLLLFNLPGVFGNGDLVPIRPNGGGIKRRDAAALDLKNQETFLWGNSGDANALANLTVYMPGDAENIVNMEQFDGMLKSIECNSDNIAMTFDDDDTFAYAQQVWDWVNGADNHSFVMVAGAGDCGNNTRRIPYVISTMAFNEDANKAILTANQTDWQTIAHSYDLTVGGVSNNNPTNALARRDIDKTTSIDFNHDLPFSFAVAANGLEARIACTNCSSSGSFDMEFKISQKLFVPTGASMKIKPKDVSAIAQIKLTGSGEVTDKLTKEFNIIEIPISALKIPGILDLGPFLTISVGAELSAITVTAGVQSGVTAKLSNDAILEVDLLSPEENSFSGWEPQVDVLDVRVDASISGGVAVFLKAAIELQAEALGKGFSVGVNLKVPNLNAKLEAIASPQGACPAAALAPGEENKTLGVRISANIGGSLNFAVKKTSDDDPLFTVQIAAIDRPIAQVCFPFGDPIAARALPMSPVPIRHMRSAITS